MNSMYLVASSLEIFKRQNSYKLKHTISFFFFFLLRPNWNDSKIFRTDATCLNVFYSMWYWKVFFIKVCPCIEVILVATLLLFLKVFWRKNKSAVSLHQRFLKKLILYLINFILWFWLFLTFLYKWLSFFFFFEKLATSGTIFVSTSKFYSVGSLQKRTTLLRN